MEVNLRKFEKIENLKLWGPIFFKEKPEQHDRSLLSVNVHLEEASPQKT